MVKFGASLASIKSAASSLVSRRGKQLLRPDKGMFLYFWEGEGRLCAVEVDNKGQVRLLDDSASENKRKSRHPVVVLLPKSQYLVKSVDIPQVAPQELPALLRLEVEASLPPEFGQEEISFIGLPSDTAREGRLRFEIYITRNETLLKLTNSLASVGIEPSMILPTAVAWRGVLALNPEAGMLVVELPNGEIETSAGQADGGYHVRMIEKHADNGQSIAPGVVESIRSMMASGNGNDQYTVLWCGPSRPQGNLGTVRFENAFGNGDQTAEDAAFLALAGRGIGRLSNDELRTTSLSPAGHEESKRKLAVRKRLVTSILALLLGLLMIQASLWILSTRCRSAIADLDQKIAAIRYEGQTTENRLNQIAAIAAARSRQDEFQQLLAALYEFTPDGISYSEIKMDENGQVHLRGQAVSMGQPFMLPSALEGKGPLSHMVVNSAGLSKTAGGIITEFKGELMFKRGAAQP